MKFKLASKLRLRFVITLLILGETFKGKFATGEVSTEELWDYPIPVLDRLALSLQEEYKASGQKSFIRRKSPKDKILKLKLDIVVDILETKVEEEEAAKQKLEDKAHNQKIMGVIAEQEEDELKGKSKKELIKMLR